MSSLQLPEEKEFFNIDSTLFFINSIVYPAHRNQIDRSSRYGASPNDTALEPFGSFSGEGSVKQLHWTSEGESFETPIGTLHIKRFLGKGKSGYSYLAVAEGESYVLKKMHYEEIQCYNFGDANKVELETEAYKHLQTLGISVPRLLVSVPEENYLVKEFIDGTVATDFIKEKKLSPSVLSQLFDMASRLERRELNIDYFPNNFVLKDDDLYYIDYEVNPFQEEWSLSQWGIWYWANGEGMKRFAETGDPSYINDDCQGGRPYMKPFRSIVEEWIRAYSPGKK